MVKISRPVLQVVGERNIEVIRNFQFLKVIEKM